MSKQDYNTFNQSEDEEEGHKYQEIELGYQPHLRDQESEENESEIENDIEDEEEESSHYEESKSIFDESNSMNEEMKQSNPPPIHKQDSNQQIIQAQPLKMPILFQAPQNYQPDYSQEPVSQSSSTIDDDLPF